jgi:hypothetical protein
MLRFWVVFLTLLPFVLFAQDKKESDEIGLSITVYNQNFGVVKEVREIELKKGENEVFFRDVATGIDGASLHFKSLTDPDNTIVLEQNFEFDLLNATKLLQKYIDYSVRLTTKDGKVYEGILLGFDDEQIILTKDPQKGPIEIVTKKENVTAITCAELPKGFVTQPTLMWKVKAEKEGKHKVKVTYLTGNISWDADYTAVISPDEKSLDIGGWVTIRNNSGKRYENATIKLVAGGISRAPTIPEQQEFRKGALESGVEAKEFFEYYLYAMPRKTTIEDRSTKQLELLNAWGVKVTKSYRYYGALLPRWLNPWEPSYGTQCNKKVDVYLSFVNSKDNNLGMPLPAGRVRVYKKDPNDGSLEMIGEDKIEHTPKDEKLNLKMGTAFDIIGERKQTNFRRISENVFEESFEIKLRNHKKEKVEVEVWETLYRSTNWEIRNSSLKFEKEDASTIKFKVEVEPDKEVVLTYTVLYTR